MRRRNNPEWVDNLLGGYCESLHAASKRLGLPMPLLQDGPRCKPQAELGCGTFGCALRSGGKGVVFKVTRDETEAHFAAAYLELARRGVKPDGMCQYYGVLAAEPKRYFIWREEADFVGVWWEGIADEYLSPRAGLRDRIRLAQASENALSVLQYGADDILKAARAARRRMIDTDYWKWMRGEVEASHGGIEAKRWHSMARELSSAREHAVLLLARVPELSALWAAWLEYEKHGVVIGDTHIGNVGIRIETGAPIFTDPGNVTILDRSLSALPVEVIKPS